MLISVADLVKIVAEGHRRGAGSSMPKFCSLDGAWCVAVLASSHVLVNWFILIK